jgi:hypothetical protein
MQGNSRYISHGWRNFRYFMAIVVAQINRTISKYRHVHELLAPHFKV